MDSLVHFSRLLAEAPAIEAILERLAEASLDQVGADAAAVFQVTEGGSARLAAHRGLPPQCEGEVPAEGIGPELSEQLLSRCEGHFERTRSFPLVSGADLYGALVLLYRPGTPVEDIHLALAQGYVDLAAVALDQAFNRAELERTFQRMRAQDEALSRSERLRSLGQMATGIAHDLRNLFNPLKLQLGILRRAQDPAAVGQAIEAVDRAVRHGVEIVERLRLFGHQSLETKEEAVDLETLVTEAVALFHPRRAEALKVELELRRAPRVRLQAAELVSSLVNLLLNAEEAMGGEGTITLRTGAFEGTGWVQVADTGPGIPEQIRARIFEPFFTTKGQEGTGLGLSMLSAFVRRSRGTVRAENLEGGGAAFTLAFPAASLPRGAGAPAPADRA